MSIVGRTTVASMALMNMPENEKLAAQHMKWWPVYLIREKRRLREIAELMQADEEAKAASPMIEVPVAPTPMPVAQDFSLETEDGLPEQDQAAVEFTHHPSMMLPVDAASLHPEELLLMLDTDFEAQQALEELEGLEEASPANHLEIERQTWEISEPQTDDGDTQPTRSLALATEPGGANDDNGHSNSSSLSSKSRSRSRLAGKAHLLGSKQEEAGDTY